VSRRRGDRALSAVVMEAYVQGVSTRTVDELLTPLGGTGVSWSEVSRIVASLDEEREGLGTRRLDRLAFPSLCAGATYVKGRLSHQVVSRAVVVATGTEHHRGPRGPRHRGGRLGGPTPSGPTGRGARRIVASVHLVISDAHEGFALPSPRALSGRVGSAVSVHCMRDVRTPHRRRGAKEMVLA